MTCGVSVEHCGHISWVKRVLLGMDGEDGWREGCDRWKRDGGLDGEGMRFPVYVLDGEESVGRTLVEPASQTFLPRLPLLAVYGWSYVPCIPLFGAVVSTREGEDAHRMLGMVEGEGPQGLFPKSLVEEVERHVGSGKEVVSLDVALWVHATPVRQECQKFLCSETSHVALMYHTWVVDGGLAAVSDLDFLTQVSMGVFDPCNVAPVHQDLSDAGIPFEELGERTVNVHGSAFSPENAMMDMVGSDSGAQVATFWSLGINQSGRAAAVRHILPLDDKTESDLRSAMGDGDVLSDVMAGVREGGWDVVVDAVDRFVQGVLEER